MKAYLDIETCTGGQVTVVGIFREDRGFRQLVGGEITDVAVWEALDGVEAICTYNGDRFDLPVLERQTRLDLRSQFRSLDLLRECRRVGLKGGLKRLEERFGIAHTTFQLEAEACTLEQACALNAKGPAAILQPH